MSRRPLLLLAVCALAGALALAPPPDDRPGRPLTALGRSLGGARVLAVDALFLRAEALRLRGRAEELPALYQALVDLDPDNVAALDALAGELAENQLATAPGAPAQAAWWQRAWELVQHGLAVHPDSPTLAFRAAELLLRVPEQRPALAAAIDAAAGGATAREDRGLAFLVLACRATSDLPRSGRMHVVRLARAAPLLTLRALARGVPPDAAALRLAAGQDLLARRGAVLEGIDEARAGEAPNAAQVVPLAHVLSLALEVVRAALLVAAGDPAGPARDALERYRAVAGDTDLAREVAAWLATR